MLMDLFFEATDVPPQAPRALPRVHGRGARSHRARRARRVPGDPIPHVAAAIAAKARAAVLRRAARHRHRRRHDPGPAVQGAVRGAGGGGRDLQRAARAISTRTASTAQLFLPFIDLIEQHMEVEELAAAKDFRLEKLAGKPLYFTPADARGQGRDGPAVAELTGGQPGAPLTSTSRAASCTCRRRPWAWRASRSPSCASSRSARIDYLALAHAFHTLMIDGIPVLTPAQRDVARRFINLIDTLYDTRVRPGRLGRGRARRPLSRGRRAASCSSAPPRG